MDPPTRRRTSLLSGGPRTYPPGVLGVNGPGQAPGSWASTAAGRPMNARTAHTAAAPTA